MRAWYAIVMSNANIEKLLAAQKIDKERLQVMQNLEKSKVKMELDKAKQTIESSKNALLQLESDAKSLQDNYQKFAKLVADTLGQMEKAQKSQNDDADLYDEFLSKLTKAESQLAEIERRIAQKTNAFKMTSMEVAKSSAMLKNLTKMFEDAKAATAPKVQSLEKEFNEKVKGIDEKLLAKYRAIRKSKGNDIKDVVVPLTIDNRCQGCFMDVPSALVNKIKTDGWVTCDECGRIIYQA